MYGKAADSHVLFVVVMGIKMTSDWLRYTLHRNGQHVLFYDSEQLLTLHRSLLST